MANKTFYPETSIKIVKGPSKFDFILSNYDFKIIEITIIEKEKEVTIKARVNFAAAEDGSKESWMGNIDLFVPHHTRQDLIEKRSYYYNTNTRKGTIMESGTHWKIVHF